MKGQASFLHDKIYELIMVLASKSVLIKMFYLCPEKMHVFNIFQLAAINLQK